MSVDIPDYTVKFLPREGKIKEMDTVKVLVDDRIHSPHGSIVQAVESEKNILNDDIMTSAGFFKVKDLARVQGYVFDNDKKDPVKEKLHYSHWIEEGMTIRTTPVGTEDGRLHFPECPHCLKANLDDI